MSTASTRSPAKKKAKPKKYLSLRTQLLLWTTSLFAVFIISVSAAIYSVFSSSVQGAYMDQTVTTSEQVVSTYETYMKNVISVSNAIQAKEESMDPVNDPDSQKDLFNFTEAMHSNILSMALYSEEGVLIGKDSYFSDTESGHAITTQSWFYRALEEPLINHFSSVSQDSQDYYFTLSKSLSCSGGSYNAVLRIEYSFTAIAEFINLTRLGEGGHIVILNNGYETVYSSASTISSSERALYKEVILGTKEFDQDGHHFFIFLTTIPNTTWRVAIVSNFDLVPNALRTLMFEVLTFSIIFFLLFFFVITAVSNQITRPIVQLEHEMEKLESLDVSTANFPPLSGTKEVVVLDEKYRAMLDRIRSLTAEVVSEKEEETKAEMKALQNQINPHFLYNTLDSVIYLIDEGENNKAEAMIIALSRFFRLSISRGKNVIPLKDELDHARYYLGIQKMRFGDSFSYEIINRVEGTYYVQKLILQPIVENSLLHGFGEQQKKDAHILVSATEDKDYLYFVITDNGVGMLPEKVKELEEVLADPKAKSNGVGLKNVADRLHLYYGKEAYVKIHSDMDVGTVVTLRLPKKGCLKDEEA